MKLKVSVKVFNFTLMCYFVITNHTQRITDGFYSICKQTNKSYSLVILSRFN